MTKDTKKEPYSLKISCNINTELFPKTPLQQRERLATCGLVGDSSELSVKIMDRRGCIAVEDCGRIFGSESEPQLARSRFPTLSSSGEILPI